MLSRLKTICDTLEIPPYAIIAGTDNQSRMQSCKRVLQEFALAVQKDNVKYARQKYENERKMRESGFRAYRMTIRNFAMSNGVSFPRGMAGLLSGKKNGLW